MNREADFAYARWFLEERFRILESDYRICASRGADGRFANFPALWATYTMLDLVAKLYEGSLQENRFEVWNNYREAFFPDDDYDEEKIEILYKMVRNKTSHVTQPYGAFENGGKKLTWCFDIGSLRPAIRIEKKNGMLPAYPSGRPPWNVSYDHVYHVNIGAFKDDLKATVFGKNGYLWILKNPDPLSKFQKCMDEWFPK